ncbi:MAG: GNAT family N-acetyltransferase [Phycisphaerales bacterium]|nr:GNAT family N-acetyltransferase [Phycisphaerales bacterium]
MNQFARGSFEIFAPPAARRSNAIAAVFGGSMQRAARYIDQEPRQGGELIFAIADSWGGFSHAALLTRSPGRTAMLHVTSPCNPGDQAVGTALVQRAITAAGRLDARVVQVLVEPEQESTREMFLNGGMRSIGTLAYLERPRSRDFAAEPARPEGASTRPWCPTERALLERLLEETYIDSLDCPGLAKMRLTEEILDGHIHTGIIHPTSWSILEVNGIPCGVSLASEIPGAHCMELVYFGLAPAARGRGLGGYLLDCACRDGQRHGDFSMALACDERNISAMKLYKSRGFTQRLRRSALVAMAGS